MKKDFFFQSQSALLLFQLYQSKDAQNMLLMLLKIFSYAGQQHAPIKNNFSVNFNAKIAVKMDWFDSENKKKLKMKQNFF